MDEQTVFNNKQDQIKVQNQPEINYSEEKNQITSPPLDFESSSGFFSKILKFAVGLVLLGLIIFLIFNFIIPRFFQNKNEKATLVYWGLWEDKKIMDSIISDFERQNPNIQIDYVKQDIKQYRQRLTTRIYNNEGPDVFRFHNTWLPMLSGYLVPLPSDTIKKEDFQKWFYKVSQKDLVKNGGIYGIPLGIDTLSLFVNLDSFKAASIEVPKNWDEFSKDARILTVKDDSGKIKNAGAAMGTFDNITHASDIISLLFLQNGVDLGKFSASSQNTVDALRFYTDFAQGQEKVWDETLDQSIVSFAQGTLSMYFGYSWDVFVIKTLNPNLNFAIYPVPYLPGKNITVASYWAEGVSIKSKHQKEALLFLKFLAQKETVQKLFSEESKTRFFGEPYARVDLAETLKNNALAYPFVSQAQDAESSFFASDTFDDGLNSQMNVYLGNAVRSILSNTSPQTAFETLSQGVTQVLQQYEPTPTK